MSDDRIDEERLEDTEPADAGRAGRDAVAEPGRRRPSPSTSTGATGRPRPGQKVIDAAEDAGSYVPRFCYHNRMTPVGMCRQCLVEIEGPRGPMMVVSCMQDVAEGQVVRTATDGVKRAQEGVIEMLLANHPLDCPVCDKGGECPLQDQAMSNGPGESRYVEEKRHFEKPIPLSDLVLLDRERCILCDRCTRFADEVAGDKLIHFTHRGNETQVLTFPDDPFASYFSGNTVQICPVGALTAKPYRFKARPWDLDEVESTCTSCAVGCRIGRAVEPRPARALPRCRLRRRELELAVRQGPVRLRGGPLRPARVSTRSSGRAMRSNRRPGTPPSTPPRRLLGDALVRRRTRVGRRARRRPGQQRGRLHVGAARRRPRDRPPRCPARRRPADRAACACPAPPSARPPSAATIVLLGPDLKEELPVLYLRLRDAAEKRRSRIIEFSPGRERTDAVRVEERSGRVRHDAGDHRHARRRRGARAARLGRRRRRRWASQPRRVRGARGRRPQRGARRLPRCLGAAGAAPRQRGRRPVGRARPGVERRLDGLGILRAAAAGKLECLVLLGAIRSPTAPMPTSPAGRWPAHAG